MRSHPLQAQNFPPLQNCLLGKREAIPLQHFPTHSSLSQCLLSVRIKGAEHILGMKGFHLLLLLLLYAKEEFWSVGSASLPLAEQVACWEGFFLSPYSALTALPGTCTLLLSWKWRSYSRLAPNSKKVCPKVYMRSMIRLISTLKVQIHHLLWFIIGVKSL